jgi:SGNH domain (fused to AT3 domains)
MRTNATREIRITKFVLGRVEKESGANVISFDDVLYNREVCTTQMGSVFVYRDGGHLSNAGSVHVGQRMHIGQEILRHVN